VLPDRERMGQGGPVTGFFLIPALQANILKTGLETLIMKFPFACVVFLLVIIITFSAGCSGPSSAPGTGSSSSGSMPGALSQLALPRANVPFAVTDEMNQTLDLQLNPLFSQYDAIRGYEQYYINGRSDLPGSSYFSQMIIEFPPGNVTPAFEEYQRQSQKIDPALFTVSWQKDPGIGDESYALTAANRSGNPSAKTLTMVAFRKSNILESIDVITSSPDIDSLEIAARIAAAKIP